MQAYGLFKALSTSKSKREYLSSSFLATQGAPKKLLLMQRLASSQQLELEKEFNFMFVWR